MADYELAFVGAGNMAEAIARGVLAAGLLKAGQMIAADPVAARRAVFEELGLATTEDNASAAAAAARLVLAVKPQKMDEALADLADVMADDALVISIAAGVSTAKIEAALPGRKVVRVMPNTPMLVGAGMSVLVAGQHAGDAEVDWTRRLFEAGGSAIVVHDESLMDAVTAVSGSGPAYFFYLIQYMVEAAVEEGLTEDDALKLATQTAAGAARLLAESGESPAGLRRKVTSPGGTTQAACDLMDARAVPEAILDAVRAAATRSRELGA